MAVIGHRSEDKKIIALCDVSKGKIVEQDDYDSMVHFVRSEEGKVLWECRKRVTDEWAYQELSYRRALQDLEAGEYDDEMVDAEIDAERERLEEGIRDCDEGYKRAVALYKGSYSRRY